MRDAAAARASVLAGWFKRMIACCSAARAATCCAPARRAASTAAQQLQPAAHTRTHAPTCSVKLAKCIDSSKQRCADWPRDAGCSKHTPSASVTLLGGAPGGALNDCTDCRPTPGGGHTYLTRIEFVTTMLELVSPCAAVRRQEQCRQHRSAPACTQGGAMHTPVRPPPPAPPFCSHAWTPVQTHTQARAP